MVAVAAGLVIALNDQDEGTTPIGFRRAMGTLFQQNSPGSPKQGRLGEDHLRVTGTSGWAYSVSGGGLVIVRTATGGAYLVGVPSTLTVATTPPDGINPRIDVVYAYQPDPELDGASVSVELVVDVAHGLAAATPVSPSIPAGAIVLARKVVAPADPHTNAGAAIYDAAPVTGLNVQTVTWGTISGKPSTYPSTWDSVSRKPSSYPSAWSAVSGKPGSFTPSAHDHDDRYYPKGTIDSAFTNRDGRIDQIRAGGFARDPWNRNLTGQRRAAWMQDDGSLILLGHTASRRSVKQNITPVDFTEEQLRAIPVVAYRYRKEVAKERRDPDYRAATEIGTLADDLHDLGLWQFVIYEGRGDEAVPVSVHYELLALAALELAHKLADRLDALTERVTRLEGERP